MSAEIVTRGDLQIFRMQLLDGIKTIIGNTLKVEEKPEWVKSNTVRKMLNISLGTLQNLRINGKLNPIKIEGTWYYSLLEIKKLFGGGAKSCD